MMRYQDWQTRLLAFIAERENIPFSRGDNDCMLFAADGVRVMTGHDLASDFRGQYTTKKKAFALLTQAGFSTFSDVATDRLGEPLSTVRLAKRGDCVLVDYNHEVALALVDLSGKVAITAGREGILRIPAQYWSQAWGV